jgi:hypothetical protein
MTSYEKDVPSRPQQFSSRVLQIGIETIPILSATEILSHTPATAILMWIKVGQGNLAVHFRLAPRCLSWVKLRKTQYEQMFSGLPLIADIGVWHIRWRRNARSLHGPLRRRAPFGSKVHR